MNKFFVPKENIDNDTVLIKGEDVKHIIKVLRLKAGDTININDCSGNEYLGEIAETAKEEVTAKIIKKIELNNESNVKVFLFQGVPKSSKMDLIVQKATELGAYKIIPVFTKRVVKKESSGLKKIDRLRKIALEACKQSKRSLIPDVAEPVEFYDMIKMLSDMDLILVPYENENKVGIKEVKSELSNKKIEKVAIIIGPEGGFEDEEIKNLKDIGAYIVSLGPRILRTETAGFVAISLIMYEFGDMGMENKRLEC